MEHLCRWYIGNIFMSILMFLNTKPKYKFASPSDGLNLPNYLPTIITSNVKAIVTGFLRKQSNNRSGHLLNIRTILSYLYHFSGCRKKDS